MKPVSINLLCAHDRTRFREESCESIVPCGACRSSIIGTRFRCPLCNFSLHPSCKTLTPLLSTFLHPQHHLTLVTGDSPPSRRCDVCSDPIPAGGVYYTCYGCGFDLHPPCSQISPRVHHVLDPHHPLEIHHRPPYSTRCNVCRQDCQGWAYRCRVCDLDVHHSCLIKPAGVAPPPPTERSLRQPYYFGQSNGYGGINGGLLPYWLPGNMNNTTTWQHSGAAGVGLGIGSGLPIGSGSRLGFTGSLAVNLLSQIISDLIHNGLFGDLL